MRTSTVPAGVSHRFSKVGSFAMNPASSLGQIEWHTGIKIKTIKKKPESTNVRRDDGENSWKPVPKCVMVANELTSLIRWPRDEPRAYNKTR